MKRIGIFGGTFNPIHNAHISVANEFTQQTALDLCILVPAFISPFKSGEELSTAHENNAKHRIKMVEIAINTNQKINTNPNLITNKFELDNFEIDKQGISYTYQTVEHIKSKYKDCELFLLIGADNVNDFMKWKNWKEILSNATLCIAKRPDSVIDNDIIASLKHNGNVQILDTPLYDLSSSDIRKKLAKNIDCKDLLDPAVLEYIKNNKLYQ